ncbi:MAG: hypothetical protein PHU25_19090 [Deltaproteobacteria bacterium]|nr:hypothetical protein [Deltaproteobacteria bacterium]
MREEEAREIIEASIAGGGRIVSALSAQMPVVKDMMDKCLEVGIPAIMGPCESGG